MRRFLLIVAALIGVSSLVIAVRTAWIHGRPAATGTLPAVAVENAIPEQSNEPKETTTPPVEWPFLRGPAYDGHSSETGLADFWPASGPPVLWTRSLGQGYSAFVAGGGRVYTQYQTLAGQSVVCLDAETGATVWEHRYGWPYEAAGVYPGPRSTPTLSGGNLYFTTPSGTIGSLTRDGTPRWSVNALEKFAGRDVGFGYACSPSIVNDRVIIPVGGTGASLVALGARDGTTIWKSGDDAASYTPAFPIRLGNRQLVLGYMENCLIACDLDAGRLLWRLDLSQGYDEHAAWPVYEEPFLWISGPFRNGSRLLKLSEEDAPPETVWTSKLLSNDVCSSVLHDGCLYGFDLRDVQAKTHRPSRGEFRCLDFATGAERWKTDRVGQACVLVADNKLILFNDRGELILARASPDRYEELARTQVFQGEICWTPPALLDGRLYLRTQSQAACIYLGEPERLVKHSAAELFTVDDIPRGTDLRWESLLGVEPEYAFDVPSLRWLRNWFFTGLLILAGSAVLTGGMVALSRCKAVPVLTSQSAWVVFWLLSFIGGAVAMTPVSLWRQEFIFTWPVSLFVAFHATLHSARLRRGSPLPAGSSPLRELTTVCLFLIACVTYYLLCRRLSLVFEWGFLCGFAAVVPFALAERRLTGDGMARRLARAVCLLLGFTAYYWSSVAVLLLKYRIPLYD